MKFVGVAQPCWLASVLAILTLGSIPRALAGGECDKANSYVRYTNPTWKAESTPNSFSAADWTYASLEVSRCVRCLELRQCAFNIDESSCVESKMASADSVHLGTITAGTDAAKNGTSGVHKGLAAHCSDALKFKPQFALPKDRCRFQSSQDDAPTVTCQECFEKPGCLWSNTFGCMQNRGYDRCQYRPSPNAPLELAEAGYYSTNADVRFGGNFGTELEDMQRCEWVEVPYDRSAIDSSVCAGDGAAGSLRFSRSQWKNLKDVYPKLDQVVRVGVQLEFELDSHGKLFPDATRSEQCSLGEPQHGHHHSTKRTLMCDYVKKAYLTPGSTHVPTADSFKRKKAILLLGPSASGKTYSAKTILQTFLREADRVRPILGVPRWSGSSFRVVDGGIVRDSSRIYKWIREKSRLRSDLGGFTDLFSRYFKHPTGAFKKRIFDDWVEGTQNLVLIETGVDVAAGISTRFGATVAKVAGKSKLEKYIERLDTAGYEIGVMVVFASKAACEAAGRKREAEEGKRYDSKGWGIAIQLIPRTIQYILSLQPKMAPVVIVENTDKSSPKKFWLDPVTEELSVDVQDGERVIWTFQRRGEADVGVICPSDTLQPQPRPQC